ncbi:hypothetical protein [Spirochaeta dissipatitropha]
MNEHLLIMGTRSAPLRELVSSALERGYSVTTAPSGEQDFDEFLGSSEDSNLHPLTWRPGSTVSSRSVVRSASVTAESLGADFRQAILMLTPPNELLSFHTIAQGDLESVIKDVYAGPLFLMREILSLFPDEGQSVLTVILDERNQEVLPPVSSGIMHGIQRTVEVLFRSYRDSSRIIQGLRSQSDQPVQLAGYIFDEYLKKQDKHAYRWVKFSGKSGLFGKKGLS